MAGTSRFVGLDGIIFGDRVRDNFGVALAFDNGAGLGGGGG